MNEEVIWYRRSQREMQDKLGMTAELYTDIPAAPLLAGKWRVTWKSNELCPSQSGPSIL
jgi:hypothetical protein